MTSSVDSEGIVYDVIKGSGYATYRDLPDPNATGIDQDPSVVVTRYGGTGNNTEDVKRINIVITSDRRQDAFNTANDILDLLLDGPHFVAGKGLIDSVRVESLPVEVNLAHTRKTVSFTIAATSRKL